MWPSREDDRRRQPLETYPLLRDLAAAERLGLPGPPAASPSKAKGVDPSPVRKGDLQPPPAWKGAKGIFSSATQPQPLTAPLRLQKQRDSQGPGSWKRRQLREPPPSRQPPPACPHGDGRGLPSYTSPTPPLEKVHRLVEDTDLEMEKATALTTSPASKCRLRLRNKIIRKKKKTAPLVRKS